VRVVPARCEVRSATSGECGDCGFQLTGRLCSMHHERTSAFASAFSNREPSQTQPPEGPMFYVLVLWSMFSGGGAWAFKVWEIV
jgi:hypothetical protein